MKEIHLTKKDFKLEWFSGKGTTMKHKTKEYYTWWNMIGRCNYPCTDSFASYGAEGITVDPTWRVSFNSFYKDMGDAPTKDHTLDRKDNLKGYCKSNCRWATKSQQAMNRRPKKCSKVKFKGVSYEKNKKLYRARITLEGKTISLGRRKLAEDAARLYDNAAKLYFGDFALTNKKMGLL